MEITNILHRILNRTEEIIFQNLHWTVIRESYGKEVKKMDMCQRTNWLTKMIELTDNLAENILE